MSEQPEYVPFATRVPEVSPHAPLPERDEPWRAWVIAWSPLLVLAVQAVARHLAERGYERQASPWLALLPLLYLLVRGWRRRGADYATGTYKPFFTHVALVGLFLFLAQFGGLLRQLLHMQTLDRIIPM